MPYYQRPNGEEIWFGYEPTATELLRYGIDPNASSFTPAQPKPFTSEQRAAAILQTQLRDLQRAGYPVDAQQLTSRTQIDTSSKLTLVIIAFGVYLLLRKK